ncbi:MAG: flagellar hook protein FlgE [Deltaproteobacteria bacterium]|jgi:flagellar hook protein FlgE|nr:flagellar hook protein FlgE [Deltaproteobacteria bacterium]
MTFMVGFNTGRDAMISHSLALSSISDNIANTNTVGFKSQRAEFADLLAESVGGLYHTSGLTPGNGALISNIATINTQGTIEMTNREYDFAISGNGYFVVQAANGAQYYTRAGNFTIDNEGYLVTTDGYQVLGYEPGSNTLTPLLVSGINIEPTPTDKVSMLGTLDSSIGLVTPPVDPATYSDLQATASFYSYANIVTSLGEKKTINLYYFQTNNMQWEVQAYATDVDLGGVTQKPVLLNSITLNFPLTNDQANIMQVNPIWNGVASSSIEIDFNGFTSFANTSYVSQLTVNGFAGGTLDNIGVTDHGEIYGYLNNGGSALIGEFALATFVNPGSLQRIGTNNYIVSYNTAEVSIDRATVDGRGTISGGALEVSNVDMAEQFVDLIRYQRGYQAGSQIVKTLSDLVHTTLEIL